MIGAWPIRVPPSPAAARQGRCGAAARPRSGTGGSWPGSGTDLPRASAGASRRGGLAAGGCVEGRRSPARRVLAGTTSPGRRGDQFRSFGSGAEAGATRRRGADFPVAGLPHCQSRRSARSGLAALGRNCAPRWQRWSGRRAGRRGWAHREAAALPIVPGDRGYRSAGRQDDAKQDAPNAHAFVSRRTSRRRVPTERERDLMFHRLRNGRRRFRRNRGSQARCALCIIQRPMKHCTPGVSVRGHMRVDGLRDNRFAIVQARAAGRVNVTDINLPGRFGGLGLAFAAGQIPGVPVIVRI